MNTQAITPSNRSEWLASLAAWVAGRGLSAPAIVLLELIKPFGFISSQMLLVADPLIGEVGRHYAWLLEDRQHIEQLLELLESQRRHPSV